MFIKGLKEVIEKSAEAAELASQSQTRYLYVGEGDTAVIRFIDDEEMIQTKMHEYEEMTPTGKKYRKTYCVNNLTGAPCKWDAAGNIPKSVYVFLVYVYHTIHRTQNPELNTREDAVRWEAVKIGAQTLYKENVDEIRVLRVKFGKDGYLKNTILGFVEEYGTLCDRDYKFARTGSGIKTLYAFIPKDPSPMSTKVVEAKKNATSLEDILVHKKKEETKEEEPKEEEPVAIESEEVISEELESEDDTPAAVKAKAGRPKKDNSKATKEVEDLF